VLGIALDAGGLALAFAAGLVGFTSPCLLPLVPGYLSFVSGVGFDELGVRTREVTTATAAFVAGFAAMFVALGAGAAWFGTFLLENRRPLEIAAGVLVCAAALVVAGLPLPAGLARERRFVPRLGAPRLVTAAGAGLAFAVAWTPCVGPTLGAVLTLAAASDGAADGAVLLAAYSLGLGVPFLLAGLLFTRALGVHAAVRRHWRAVRLGSAALLFAFGVLLLTGTLVRLTAELSRFTDWQI
jgi:cytochrome c-type biogenesis protein